MYLVFYSNYADMMRCYAVSEVSWISVSERRKIVERFIININRSEDLARQRGVSPQAIGLHEPGAPACWA